MAELHGPDTPPPTAVHQFPPAIPQSAPGATGRVVLLDVRRSPWHAAADEFDELSMGVAQSLDELLTGGAIDAPVLVVSTNELEAGNKLSLDQLLEQAVLHSVERCALRVFLKDLSASSWQPRPPQVIYRLDGAYCSDETSKAEGEAGVAAGRWDVSEVLVWDDFVEPELREQLLDAVRGTEPDSATRWDDAASGPDPLRWERGGLGDVPSGAAEEEEGVGPCWGLRREAVEDLCFNQHDAISEVEGRLVR